jgi:hypothetical protein
VFEEIPNFRTVFPGRSLGPKPPSAFPAWDGTRAIIYDTATGRIIDLGPGAMGNFSPDGKWATWVAGDVRTAGLIGLKGEVGIVNLETGESRLIAEGMGAIFPDSERVALQLPRTELQDAVWKLFDIETLQPSADQTTPGQPSREHITSTGHILVATPVAGTGLPRGGYGAARYQLLDPVDRHLVMEFEAFAVADATATELVVASAWTEIPVEPFKSGAVNLYLLDVRTGRASLFAQARASTINWPLSANEDFVLWTNDFCSDDRMPQPVLFERRSGTGFAILRMDAVGEPVEMLPGSNEALLALTSRGLIREGAFGTRALIDPVNLEYIAVVPDVKLIPELQNRGPVQPGWSSDYRYAAYWQGGGRGGLC